MSSIRFEHSDTDSVSPLDVIYKIALHFPVTDIFLSIFELKQKAQADKKYHGEIGEKYASLSDRYFALKSYPEICCTFVWGVGEMALLGLHYYKQSKGADLYKLACNDPDPAVALELLKKAANQYRFVDAIYLLGTYYRDGNGVSADADLALAHFHEAASLGDQRSQIALGNLYLSGLAEHIPQNLQKALLYFHKANGGKNNHHSHFAKYREDFVHLLFKFGTGRQDVLDFIARANDRFDVDFSLSNDLVVSLAIAFRNNELPMGFKDDAEQLLRCAALHLPNEQQKADIFYLLAHSTNKWSDYESAAAFGHRPAAFELSVLKRDHALTLEHGDKKNQLLRQAFMLLAKIPPQDLQKDFKTAVLLGHYYMGFGSEKPQFDKVLECYKWALNGCLEAEKFKIQFLIGYAAILQEMELKNTQAFDGLHRALKSEASLWKHLPLEDLSPLPLVTAIHLLENGQDTRTAQQLFELCVRQPEQSMKLISYYSLSRLDVARRQEHLEQCLKLDPQHYRARMDLFTHLKDINTQLADFYLQPVLDRAIPEALFLKALYIISQADKLIQQKGGGFGFGQGQTQDSQRKVLLLQARDLMVPAARAGFEPACQSCLTQGWSY